MTNASKERSEESLLSVSVRLYHSTVMASLSGIKGDIGE